jgi:regulator of nucleoside diphosphate kinase
MTPARSSLRRPPIELCETDRAALERCALGAMLEAPRIAGPLLEEVDRARIVPDARLASDRVRLGSFVVYRDEASGEHRGARLVAGAHAGAAGEVSVLSPEGAALVRLGVGQSILWPDRRGAARLLTILSTTFEGADPS